MKIQISGKLAGKSRQQQKINLSTSTKKSKGMVIIGEKGVSIQEGKDVFITIVNECIM